MRAAVALDPLPTVAIVCFDFSRGNVRRQPWHVAHGLACGLAASGHPVLLLTDAVDPPQDRPYAVWTLPSLGAAELRRALMDSDASRVLIITGATALARGRTLDLGRPVSLVMASPRLRLAEILGLGLHLWHERELLGLPLLGALLPGAVLRAGFARSGADEIVYLSAAAQRRFSALGLPVGRRITPRVEPDRILPLVEPRPRPRIAYLGPPLEARGAWTALETFETAVARGLDAELLLLIRPDVPRAVRQRYRARVSASPVRGRIRLIVRMLDAEELRRELAPVTVFLLPFRAPVSEVPLVVLEAGASGRRLVTLDAPGVGEFARDLGGVVATDRAGLPAALTEACALPPLPPPVAASWTGEAAALAEAPLPDPSRLRFIGLAGVDGAGKTFLVDRLRQRLADDGIATRHVWSRFRNYTSKPLLALLRLTGHNRKEVRDGVRIGYHDLQRARPLGLLFIALQTVDQLLDLTFRYRLRGDQNPIVGDRCVLDTLVDLAVDTGRDRLVLERIGPRLMRLLPSPRCLFVVRRDVAAIAASRPDALADRHFARRRALYERSARLYRLPVIDNDDDPAVVVERILDVARAAARGDRP